MRILLVEDDNDTRTTLGRLLEKWGHHVDAAEDLRHARALLNSEPFDALLSDISLPDGTGYTLVKEARRHPEPLLAIAMSAVRFPNDERTQKITGFDHHLEKPLDCGLLRSLLADDFPHSSHLSYGG